MEERAVKAMVTQVSPLTDTILQVFLQPETYVDYQAGQYLQIIHQNESLSFSIANAPLGAKQYELHIRHCRDNPLSQSLLRTMQEEGAVSLLLPFGECRLDKLRQDRDIVFVAGGTGFAPVKAMIEQLLANSDLRPFTLFWSARSKSDLYMDEKLGQWQAHINHFHYHTLLSSQNRAAMFELIQTHLLKDLKQYQFVLSGPFEFVYALRDALVAAGVEREQLYSDAFGFEK